MNISQFLSKYWWVSALLSFVCAFFTDYIGWYALTALAAAAAASYVLHLAIERIRRIEKAKNMFSHAGRKTRDQLSGRDQKELKQISGLSNTMVPFLVFGSMALNLYTCWFYSLKGRILAPVRIPVPMPILLFLYVIFTIFAFAGFYLRVKEILMEA